MCKYIGRGVGRVYSEQYNHRGFSIRDILLRLILIIVLGLSFVILLPKIIKTDVITNNDSSGVVLSSVTSQIQIDNLEKLKKAAISYYTEETLPKKVGDSQTMTLSEMIEEKKVVTFMDMNNQSFDNENSYVKITKLEEGYLLKVNLKDEDHDDYRLVHLGNYTYCEFDVCEKRY